MVRSMAPFSVPRRDDKPVTGPLEKRAGHTQLGEMAFLFIAVAVLLFIAWLFAEPLLTERRRRNAASLPFSPAWRRILEERVPAVGRLPASLRHQLERHIQVFLAEKDFIGCDGLDITDEMRVTIAAQACLLLLNRRTKYFPNLRTILVYPGAFVVERLRAEPSGVLQEQREVLSGESWSRGQVILSWEDTLAGAAIPDDGRNVVIHEFAHQLDQEKGYANGAPWLGRRERYGKWSRTLGEEFATLQRRAMLGEPSLFSYYGATNPAEFFAVITEVFFEQPVPFAQLHPALYDELVALYRVDPANW